MTMTEEQIKENIMDLTDNYHFNVGEMGFTAEKATELLEIDILNLIKQAQYEYVEEICKWIDDIESSYKDTSLEEWKAFKDIRSTIRYRNEERRGK